MSVDLFSTADFAMPDPPAPVSEEEQAEALATLLASAAEAEKPTRKAERKPVRRKHEEHHFELSSNAIDLDSILGDYDKPSVAVPAASDDGEVDLSIDVDDIEHAGSALAPEPPPAPPPSEDLEDVFGNMRDQSRRSGLDEAEKEYKRGLALRKAGDIDGCIQALQKASRAPKLRFATSWLIARLYRDRDMMPEALEWLERASEAPASNTEDGHQVLYELADALEKSGEVARALAICMGLESDAAGYRDVAERVDRLTKVQSGG
jgi:tetratricopeptide (TPR) repeat protein